MFFCGAEARGVRRPSDVVERSAATTDSPLPSPAASDVTSGPALATHGDVRRWNWAPSPERVGGALGPQTEKKISWSDGAVLELMIFDFSGDLLRKIEEFERAEVTFQRNVSGE